MMFPCFSMIFPWFSHDVSMIFHVFVHDFPWFSYDCPWFLGDSHLECLSCRSPGARADDPLHAQQAPLRGAGRLHRGDGRAGVSIREGRRRIGRSRFFWFWRYIFWLDIRNITMSLMFLSTLLELFVGLSQNGWLCPSQVSYMMTCGFCWRVRPTHLYNIIYIYVCNHDNLWFWFWLKLGWLVFYHTYIYIYTV